MKKIFILTGEPSGDKLASVVVSNLQQKKLDIESQIINDNNIYYLPLALVVLDDEEKEMVESVWPQQLLRDSLLAELSILLLLSISAINSFPVSSLVGDSIDTSPVSFIILSSRV